MNSEPRSETREQLLDRYAITPQMARAYIEFKHRVMIEDLVEHGGLKSHADQSLLKIALSPAGDYLLEEVYLAIREEFEANERAERQAAGFDMVVNPLTETDHGRRRFTELRDLSLGVINWYNDLPKS